MRTKNGTRAAALALLLGSGLAACDGLLPQEGYDKLAFRQRQPLPAVLAPDPPPAVASLGGAAAAEIPAVPAGAPAEVTQAMVEEGARLYGTVCGACHGPGGAGTPAGPGLRDTDWIHIGGSFPELVNIITVGVTNPQQYPAAMPPRGGGPFDDEQVRALAAYVFALSHGS